MLGEPGRVLIEVELLTVERPRKDRVTGNLTWAEVHRMSPSWLKA
jgi:hypothetical protein